MELNYCQNIYTKPNQQYVQCQCFFCTKFGLDAKLHQEYSNDMSQWCIKDVSVKPAVLGFDCKHFL